MASVYFKTGSAKDTTDETKEDMAKLHATAKAKKDADATAKKIEEPKKPEEPKNGKNGKKPEEPKKTKEPKKVKKAKNGKKN